jgi:uncharacterized protein (TIRG00374 family)
MENREQNFLTSTRRPLYLRPSFGLALRTILAVVLLVLLFRFVNIQEVSSALISARLPYLVGALVLVVANIGLQVLKWRYFVRLIDANSSTFETASAILLGITLGIVTPGQIGEFGGRALRHASLPVGSVIGLTLVDKVQMMCVMGVAGTISLLVLLQVSMPLGLLVGLIATAGFIFVFFGFRHVVSLIRKFSPALLERLRLREFLAAFDVFKLRDLLTSLAFSLAFYGIIYLQMYLLLNAFENVGPQYAFLGFASMMFLKSLIPISLGDLGIREASSVYFYSLCGIAYATSLNASLLLFVINILLPSIVGLLFIPKLTSR